MATPANSFGTALQRLDALVDQQASRLEAVERQAALEADFARAQRQRDASEARRQIQATYADAFRSFGSEVPAPVDDEAPARYRARLYNRLTRKLPPNHRLAELRADDMGSQPQVLDLFEKQLLEAAAAEGASPSEANLPSDGTIISRQRSDNSNGKSVEFYGTESYIKSMGRPGRRVLRLVNPKDGRVLLGAPFPRAD